MCIRDRFDVSDQRTLDEVVAWLLEEGHIPSFCTACYRAVSYTHLDVYKRQVLWEAVVHGAHSRHPKVSATGRAGFEYYLSLIHI